MNARAYTLPAVLMHWLQAGLIFWLLWLGLTMVDLPKGAERSAAYGLHKSLGLLVLMFTVIRFAWRRGHPPPPLLAAGWEVWLSTLVHRALYLGLLLVPLSGYLLTCFTPYPLKFFGWEVIKLGWPDENLNRLFKQAHVVLMWSMVGLIALHIAGALKHALLRDGTLRRMLPGRSVH